MRAVEPPKPPIETEPEGRIYQDTLGWWRIKGSDHKFGDKVSAEKTKEIIDKYKKLEAKEVTELIKIAEPVQLPEPIEEPEGQNVTILGVSAFGLKDCVAQHGMGCRELGFYPTSAVLPTNPFARILTGEEAYKDRTHAGLSWPPEARIQVNEPLRRCPISIVWRALTEAGDRMVRWDAGRGVSFSLARILAKHVKGLLNGSTYPNPSSVGNAKSESSILTLAIPDHLDEFGQELLLRELAALGYPKAFLVWRPVAAALSWLDKVESELTHISENDHIHVIYLGPDALEFTSFRLRMRLHNNRHYILPRRDRPKALFSLTGVDWTGRFIEENFAEIDDGAFWQAFIQFPEIWQAIAGQKWDTYSLPRPWSRNREWTLWNPAPELCSRIYQTSTASCTSLRRILNNSCKINSHKEKSVSSIGEALQREIQRSANLFPGGRLRGLIVCGPLAPRTLPQWLFSQREKLVARGLNIEGNLVEPKTDHLWLSADCDDPISAGAAIYGQRMLAGNPSYLDTMPQISILAHGKGRFVWVPLLKAQEVLGGEWHNPPKIDRKFQLDAGKRNLHVYLYKGSVADAPTESEDSFDPKEVPLEGLSSCQARLSSRSYKEARQFGGGTEAFSGSIQRRSLCAFFR